MRKALKVKGSSIHNGRGGYDCVFDISTRELFQRVKAKVVEWNKEGLVEKIEETSDHLYIALKNKFTCPYYRGFYFDKRAEADKWKEYGCTMVF